MMPGDFSIHSLYKQMRHFVIVFLINKIVNKKGATRRLLPEKDF